MQIWKTTDLTAIAVYHFVLYLFDSSPSFDEVIFGCQLIFSWRLLVSIWNWFVILLSNQWIKKKVGLEAEVKQEGAIYVQFSCVPFIIKSYNPETLIQWLSVFYLAWW